VDNPPMKRAVAHTLHFVSTLTDHRVPLVIQWISFDLACLFPFINVCFFIEITDLTGLISAYQERKYVEDLDYF